MDKSWKINEEQTYADFRIFSAKRSQRVNPRTGKPFDFFLMTGLDWVNIIPITPDNQVILVRQFRHGVNAYTIEIPGGVVEPNEDPKVSALRELTEETGFAAVDAEHLGTVDANSAMQSMRLHSYVARNVTLHGQQILDSGEDITVITKPFGEVQQMILDGTIRHSLVVAAFGFLAMRSQR